MNSTQQSPHPKQQPTSHLTRTKLRLKPHKGHRQGQENQQPLFNDPLYQHLDNEVFNREQHNFGPWVEMDRRSRQRTRQRRTHMNVISDLPELHQERIPALSTMELTQPTQNGLQDHSQPQNINLPNIRERGSRATSLQELRGVSIHLNAPEGRDQSRFRREYSLVRQPFFLRAQGSIRLGANSGEYIVKRSNVIYNYCLREQEQKIVSGKLNVKAGEVYMKLQNVKKGLSKVQFSNKDLMKELKQYRINKYK